MAVIDHHAHFVPSSFSRVVERLADDQDWGGTARAFLDRFGADGSAQPLIGEIASRVDSLDAAGIDVQILSLGASTIWHRDESIRRHLTESFNEGTLEATSEHPGRFALFASLSIPHLELAIRESTELIGRPGVAGFGITAHPDGGWIDEPHWRPLLETWSSLGATVFIHPDPPASPLWDDYWLRWGFGAVVDDALVAIRLGTSGVLDEFPGIRWIIPHAGGSLASSVERLDKMWEAGRLPATASEKPSHALRRLSFDSATTDATMLSNAVTLFGAERLLLGTDFPLGDTTDLGRYTAALRHATSG
ncbi:MAG: amidohydrolase [Microbacteriaceae bacterium]|nr:amidohydrolase [Microbacteriaceae bacterium]